MESDARPAGHATGLFLPRPIHRIGFHVSDLRAAIDTWLAVYRAGPFYVSEHVAYDECTSRDRSEPFKTAWSGCAIPRSRAALRRTLPPHGGQLALPCRSFRDLLPHQLDTKIPANPAKPSWGLEPQTPSLPWKCSTS